MRRPGEKNQLDSDKVKGCHQHLESQGSGGQEAEARDASWAAYLCRRCGADHITKGALRQNP